MKTSQCVNPILRSRRIQCVSTSTTNSPTHKLISSAIAKAKADQITAPTYRQGMPCLYNSGKAFADFNTYKRKKGVFC